VRLRLVVYTTTLARFIHHVLDFWRLKQSRFEELLAATFDVALPASTFGCVQLIQVPDHGHLVSVLVIKEEREFGDTDDRTHVTSHNCEHVSKCLSHEGVRVVDSSLYQLHIEVDLRLADYCTIWAKQSLVCQIQTLAVLLVVGFLFSWKVLGDNTVVIEDVMLLDLKLKLLRKKGNDRVFPLLHRELKFLAFACQLGIEDLLNDDNIGGELPRVIFVRVCAVVAVHSRVCLVLPFARLYFNTDVFL